MAIKSLVKDTAEAPKTDWKKVKYPAIGQAVDGETVLFRAYGEGMCIKAGNDPYGNKVGTYYEIWEMRQFNLAKFTKLFILSNR